MTMKKNMGDADKVIRTLLAMVIAILYMAGLISGTVAVVLGIHALVFLLTSYVGTCPLYLPFGISTRRNKPRQ